MHKGSEMSYGHNGGCNVAFPLLGIPAGKALAYDRPFKALSSAERFLSQLWSSILGEGTEVFHSPAQPRFKGKPAVSPGSSLHPTHQGMLLGLFSVILILGSHQYPGNFITHTRNNPESC